jgi:hypothetical protein
LYSMWSVVVERLSAGQNKIIAIAMKASVCFMLLRYNLFT